MLIEDVIDRKRICCTVDPLSGRWMKGHAYCVTNPPGQFFILFRIRTAVSVTLLFEHDRWNWQKCKLLHSYFMSDITCKYLPFSGWHIAFLFVTKIHHRVLAWEDCEFLMNLMVSVEPHVPLFPPPTLQLRTGDAHRCRNGNYGLVRLTSVLRLLFG